MRNFNQLKKSGVVLASVAASIGFTACGNGSKKIDNKSTEVAQPAKTTSSATQGSTIQELSRSITELSEQYRGSATVPSELCLDTNDNPQKTFGRNPIKLIVNTLCQPPLGEPASLYQSATFSSEKLGRVADGDIVEAICIDKAGQQTTNVIGGGSESDTWVKIQHEQEAGFISEVNLAYVDDAKFKEC